MQKVESDVKINKLEVYSRLKETLAAETDKKILEIHIDDVLTNDLGFTINGKRSIASKLNEKFSDVGLNLIPDDSGSADTVRKLSEIIWNKIPAINKS